jgi:NAD(P)-dependent dehydrogenase (short-subunit alcohol dehydrogenase family)
MLVPGCGVVDINKTLAAAVAMVNLRRENLEDPAAADRVIEFAVARFGRLDALVHM